VRIVFVIREMKNDSERGVLIVAWNEIKSETN
jgi:hypothetical protein